MPQSKTQVKPTEVKFLKNGMPFGFGYAAEETAELVLTKAQIDKLVKLGVITKL